MTAGLNCVPEASGTFGGPHQPACLHLATGQSRCLLYEALSQPNPTQPNPTQPNPTQPNYPPPPTGGCTPRGKRHGNRVMRKTYTLNCPDSTYVMDGVSGRVQKWQSHDRHSNSGPVQHIDIGPEIL